MKAQLELKGSSFAAIAEELGCRRQSVQQAMHQPSDAQERAIAKKLGVTQQQLFPERYDPRTGRRLHEVKHSGGEAASNVKESRVA